MHLWSRHHRDRAQRSAGSATDLHRERDDNGSRCRQLIQVRQVLEARNVAGSSDPVNLEVGGIAGIDRRDVGAKCGYATLLDEQSSGIGTKAGEMQLRRVSGRAVAQVFEATPPAAAPPGAEKDD